MKFSLISLNLSSLIYGIKEHESSQKQPQGGRMMIKERSPYSPIEVFQAVQKLREGRKLLSSCTMRRAN
ncbi:hypothetical protein CapIbe_012183 [Capra ibex]